MFARVTLRWKQRTTCGHDFAHILRYTTIRYAKCSVFLWIFHSIANLEYWLVAVGWYSDAHDMTEDSPELLMHDASNTFLFFFSSVRYINYAGNTLSSSTSACSSCAPNSIQCILYTHTCTRLTNFLSHFSFIFQTPLAFSPNSSAQCAAGHTHTHRHTRTSFPFYPLPLDFALKSVSRWNIQKFSSVVVVVAVVAAAVVLSPILHKWNEENLYRKFSFKAICMHLTCFCTHTHSPFWLFVLHTVCISSSVVV